MPRIAHVRLCGTPHGSARRARVACPGPAGSRDVALGSHHRISSLVDHVLITGVPYHASGGGFLGPLDRVLLRDILLLLVLGAL